MGMGGIPEGARPMLIDASAQRRECDGSCEAPRQARSQSYSARFTPGGCQVPLMIDGAVSWGQ